MGHGSMSYQLKLARLMMISVNVILFLIGATLLGEGIELLITPRFQTVTEFIPLIENSTVTRNKLLFNEILCIIMIIPGLILVFIGFFGCSGTITQIQCLLFSYSCLMGIVLIFQTMIIISFITLRSKLKEQFILTIRLFLRDRYEGPLKKNLQFTSILSDWMMYHFKCCGIENKDDFDITLKWNRTNPWWNNSMIIENRYFKYPLTCCPLNESFNQVLSCAINGSDIYEISCYKRFMDTVHSIEGFIFIIILLIILLEMFAFIFVLIIHNRHQMRRISNVMERSSPLYSLQRTRINNANVYFQI